MGGRTYAVLSRVVNEPGQRMLILPGDRVVFVPADSAEDDLVEQFEVESMAHAPMVEVWPGTCLDGPLARQSAYVFPNELGARSEFRLSQLVGGRRGSYVVTRMAEDHRPAELRFAGWADD